MNLSKLLFKGTTIDTPGGPLAVFLDAEHDVELALAPDYVGALHRIASREEGPARMALPHLSDALDALSRARNDRPAAPSRTGTFQLTDATGIPAVVTITAGTHRVGPARAVSCLEVHASKCGMDFGVVARLLEPDGPAPVIQVERGLGADTVRLLLDHFDGRASLPSAN